MNHESTAGAPPKYPWEKLLVAPFYFIWDTNPRNAKKMAARLSGAAQSKGVTVTIRTSPNKMYITVWARGK